MSTIFGALAIAVGFGLKAFYSHAGASDLLWILGPSAWLARVVGGIDLVYEEGAGFISHTHHLVVGPACAGVNFLVICFLCLYFSFGRHFESKPRWILCSLLVAFAATIVANGFRIFIAAHLWNADFYNGGITREGAHRVAGTIVYYASLLLVYLTVGSRVGVRAPTTSPLAWYLGVSLGVPFLGRILSGGPSQFAFHAASVAAVAVGITAVKWLPSTVRNRIHLGP